MDVHSLSVAGLWSLRRIDTHNPLQCVFDHGLVAALRAFICGVRQNLQPARSAAPEAGQDDEHKHDDESDALRFAEVVPPVGPRGAINRPWGAQVSILGPNLGDSFLHRCVDSA